MISKQQFASQMSRLSALFMRETPKEMLREYYDLFQNRDLGVFEKAVSDIIRQEDRFPSPKTINQYYETNEPDTPKEPWPGVSDLDQMAKDDKAKHYCSLVHKLYSQEISVEDDEVQACLTQHHKDVRARKCDPVFTHYDVQRKIFIRPWRDKGV